jgi:hypothetical protein
MHTDKQTSSVCTMLLHHTDQSLYNTNHTSIRSIQGSNTPVSRRGTVTATTVTTQRMSAAREAFLRAELLLASTDRDTITDATRCNIPPFRSRSVSGTAVAAAAAAANM